MIGILPGVDRTPILPPIVGERWGLSERAGQQNKVRVEGF